jgi:transposase
MREAAMKDIISLLDTNLTYLDHQIIGDHILVLVESNRDEVQCPYCGIRSSRVHSTYNRSFQDLPIQGKKVYVNIVNRKYFCNNENCEYTTFAESFGCLGSKAKKSERLIEEIMKISLEVSSVAAAKMLRAGVVDVSKSTICDMLKKNGRSVGQGKRRENLHR